MKIEELDAEPKGYWAHQADKGAVALPPKAAELYRILSEHDDYFGLLIEVMDEAIAGHQQALIREIESEEHDPSCCGGCEVCFSHCGGYHGRERRLTHRREGDKLLWKSLEYGWPNEGA